MNDNVNREELFDTDQVLTTNIEEKDNPN